MDITFILLMSIYILMVIIIIIQQICIYKLKARLKEAIKEKERITRNALLKIHYD